jgi:hypothetical protein
MKVRNENSFGEILRTPLHLGNDISMISFGFDAMAVGDRPTGEFPPAASDGMANRSDFGRRE